MRFRPHLSAANAAASPRCTSWLPWIFSLALASAPELLAAKALPPIDALSQVKPAAGNPARHFGSGELTSFHGHYDERLGLPTFLSATPGTVRGSGTSLLIGDPAQIARGYLKSLANTYRISATEIDSLPVANAQYLPNGAALVQFSHAVNGIDVFRERVGVLISADGALNSVGGYVSGVGSTGAVRAGGLFRRGVEEALAVALQDFGFDRAVSGALRRSDARDNYAWYTFSGPAPGGQVLMQPARTKPVWFRMPGGLVPAWYAEVDVIDPATGDESHYAYVVGAKDGSILFRHDLVQYDAFAYRVWAEVASPHFPYPGPQGRNATPYPGTGPDGFQAPYIAPTLISLTNAMAPTSVGVSDPWLPGGATQTLGNNVDAYSDLDGIDGFTGSDYRASTTSANTFDRTYNVAQAPQVSQNQVMASVTQLFYVTNWLHDSYYDSGFDEAAGNAQSNNYGRGGAGGDPLHAEVGNNPSLNNANMATPADGASPRMQMFVFKGASAASVAATGTVTATFPVGLAAYGPQTFDTTAAVVYALDTATHTLHTGCSTIDAAVSGKIALVDRGGGCSFKAKTRNAQIALAAGVIIVNTADPANLLGDDATIVDAITIPTLGLSLTDGGTIKSGLPGVNAELKRGFLIDRDAAIDNSVVAHEWGHYISNRLIHDSAGLNSNMAGGEGEGFADFHAMLMMVEAGDAGAGSDGSFSGIYGEAGYAADNTIRADTGYYYGYRRYPYSTDMTKNPLTYMYIQDSAGLPPSPPANANGYSNSDAHNTGEVWASMLWECYASLLRDTPRLTFAQAQDRMKRYLVGGYKLMPIDPTFPEARDAILSVALSQDAADYADCAGGFAKRGLGAGAVSPDRFSTNNEGVVESFVANKSTGAWVSASLSDKSPGTCDAVDGFLDGLESGTFTIKLHNEGFLPLSSTLISVSSPDPAVILPASPFPIAVTAQYAATTIPVAIELGDLIGGRIIILNYSASDVALLTTVAGQSQFFVNVDLAASKTDDFENPILGWTPASPDFASPDLLWRREQIDGVHHVAFGPDNGAQGVTMLVSPAMQVAASGTFSISFQQAFDFEASDQTYDGGVIEISNDGGNTWQDVKAAGGVLTPDYNGVIYDEFSNPLAGRQAYVASSGAGLAPASINFGTAFQGQSVKLRFVVGSDGATGAPGWQIDGFAASGITNKPFTILVADPGHCIPDRVFANGFDGL